MSPTGRILIAVAGWTVAAVTAGICSPPPIFVDFEQSAGWMPAPVSGDGRSVRLVQGEAKIVARDEEGSAQLLELGPSMPFAAAYVDISTLAQSPVLYCEVYAQPVAVTEDSDYEFFEVGGAVLGFFRVGDRGEVRALYAREGQDSVWISTGLQFDLDQNGVAKDWLHVRVVLDQLTGRWELAINGMTCLSGLRRVVTLPDLPFPLWMYGDEQQASRFDDLLISATPRNEIERQLRSTEEQRQSRARANHPISAPRKVTQEKSGAELRHLMPSLRATKSSAPAIRDLSVTLKTGEQTYHTGAAFQSGRYDLKLAAYSPQYDNNGKLLPGVLTITADAELKPGADLALLTWRVVEVKGELHEHGGVIVHGTFATGLVQTCTLPASALNKPMMVLLGRTPEPFELELRVNGNWFDRLRFNR